MKEETQVQQEQTAEFEPENPQPQTEKEYMPMVRWIGLVAAILAVILFVSLTAMYTGISEKDLPQYTVTWAEQTLQPAGYNWSIPVTGKWLNHRLKQTVSDTPQQLQLVEESHPTLNVPEYTDAALTIQDQDGNTVFDGSGLEYQNFAFARDGIYTVTLTVSSTESTDDTRRAEGEYTYRFQFELQANPTLLVSSQRIAQGGTIGVRIKGALGDIAPTLQTEFADAVCTLYKGEWVAFLPIKYNQPAGEYEISATVNGQTVSQTVEVYVRQYRDLDTSTTDGTASIPYVGALPKSVDYLWQINDPDIYWEDSFIQPVQGKVLRDYGVHEYVDRLTPENAPSLTPEMIAEYNAGITSRQSVNVTFATQSGSELVAPAAGRVVYAGQLSGAGRTIVIEHGCGLKSLFYTVGRIDVNEGDFVTQGEQIGTVQGQVICEMRLYDTPISPWEIWRGSGGVYFAAE